MLVKKNIEEIIPFLTDASNFEGNAETLFIPENTEELSEIIIEHNENKIPYYYSGGGTGLAGGRVPLSGSVISLEKFNKIIEINTEVKYAIIEPGVTLQELDEALEGTGLFYAPNPTEKLSSIGGNLANNSSGARTYKYGSTRDYVEELEVILPDGEPLILTRGQILANNLTFDFLTPKGTRYEFNIPDYSMPKVKHAAGLYFKPYMDLIDLLIGSEGLLCCFTKVKLKLVNTPPNAMGLIVFFNSDERLFSALNSLKSGNNELIKPRIIEFFGKNSLDLIKTKFSQIPEGANTALWVEQEYFDGEEDKYMQAYWDLIEKECDLADSIWTAINRNEHDKFKEFRHALPLAANEKTAKLGAWKIGADCSVPDEYAKYYYEFSVKTFDEYNLDYVIYGHIGNSHYHANLFPDGELAFENAKKAYKLVVEEAVKLSGTISAEHGVGKIKTPYLKILYNESVLAEMRNIKLTFDPNNLANKGNMLEF